MTPYQRGFQDAYTKGKWSPENWFTDKDKVEYLKGWNAGCNAYHKLQLK